MSDNIQELRTRILKMEQNLDFLTKTMSALAKNIKPSKYMDESEVMELLDIKISQMRRLRKNGVLLGYSSTGKKFKYNRKEVEEYLEGKKGHEMLQVSVKYYRSKKQNQD